MRFRYRSPTYDYTGWLKDDLVKVST